MNDMSILQLDKKCALCGRVDGLERHHVMHGTANRRLAEKYGLTVWLCAEHHRGKMSPHQNHNIDVAFKMAAQKAFEQIYSHEEWMEIFGKNYL